MSGEPDGIADPRLSYADTAPRARPVPGDTLVLGDWAIDEHWVTGTHRSETASRAGDVHVRSLHGVYSAVASLGGVGHVASLLHLARKAEQPDNPLFGVIGVGIWNGFDTGVIRRMFWPPWLAQVTPFRLSAVLPKKGRRTGDSSSPTKPSLVNLASVLQDSQSVQSLLREYELDGRPRHAGANESPVSLPFFDWHGTNRVIRVYRELGKELRQVGRIDWQLVAPDMGDPAHPAEWITEDNTAEKLRNFVDRVIDLSKIKRLIIGDLVKGVVSPKVITVLVDLVGRKNPDCEWYVSTKNWRASWISQLSGVKRLRLLLFHEAAARAAMREHKVDRWITRTGTLTFDAMECLHDIHTRTGAELVLVMPGGWAIAGLAKLANASGTPSLHTCVQSNQAPGKVNRDGPTSLPFMAGLVAAAAGSWSEQTIRNAFQQSCGRVATELERLREPRVWAAPTMYLAEPAIGRSSELSGTDWREFHSWDAEYQKWRASRENLCCIRDGSGQLTIQLWRAMTTLDGYVCLVPERKRSIQRVLRRVRDFARRPRADRQPLSCMLRAAPGSGKTYLAQCLAAEAGMTLLEFDISQMFRRTDILDCFDTIVTRQTTAKRDDKDVLVFVDEVNASIEGQTVYSAFLGPLESGRFVRSGKTYAIRPCVWLFAGTTDPSEQSTRAKSDKASDFESRLTAGTVNLNVPPCPLQRAENVYLGVSLVKATFPDVRQIAEPVLQVFYDLPLNISLRELRHFVESFEHVQYGQVTLQNVPLETLEGWGIASRNTPSTCPPLFVRIESAERV